MFFRMSSGIVASTPLDHMAGSNKDILTAHEVSMRREPIEFA
jgi:hypothetical protein